MKLVRSCLLSLLLYALVFGFVLDRPLAYGFLAQQIDAKVARGAAVPSPKLVILAGSNAPYSHSCETIEPIVGRPCVNAGVAVGIGLDYLFARWRPLLHPGDIVYLPMEEAQYARSRAANAVGPDAAIMFRFDWHTLGELPGYRWLGALFSFDMRFAVMSLVEHALVAEGFHDPRAEVTGTTNAWGDHVGHTADRGDPAGADAHPAHVDAESVASGEGTHIIAKFIRWANAHQVQVIGGWSTEPAGDPMSDSTRVAIRAVYERNGAAFLELPNRSLYPRSAFFDSPDHLNEEWQKRHSVLLARALRQMITQPTALDSATSSRLTPAASDTGADQEIRRTCSFCARSQPSTSAATMCQSPCPPAILRSASGWSVLQ